MNGVIPPMKRQISIDCLVVKHLIRLLALLLVFGVSPPVLLAEDSNGDHDNSRVGMLGEFQKKSIVGSWVETVKFTTDPGRPDIQSLVHFNGDGTLGSSDQGGVMTDPPPTTVTSDGVGVWKQVDWRTFSYTELALFSDFSGNLTGSLKVSGTYVLKGFGDGFGDTYEGTSFYQVFGPTRCLVPPG
jgi:hypothetical protein